MLVTLLSSTACCHQTFNSVTHIFALFTIQNKPQVDQPCDLLLVTALSTTSMLVTMTMVTLSVTILITKIYTYVCNMQKIVKNKKKNRNFRNSETKCLLAKISNF